MDLAAIDQELDKLKLQLADLKSRYEEGFPEVRKLKLQIAETEKMRDQRLGDLKTKGTRQSARGRASRSRRGQRGR